MKINGSGRFFEYLVCPKSEVVVVIVAVSRSIVEIGFLGVVDSSIAVSALT